MEWTNGLWTFSGESKKKIGHPAPFPVELPRRCIKLFSFLGDIVLDPFMGSGSTLIAAYLNKRKGIGVEIDKNYCELAKQRLIREGKINQLSLIDIGVNNGQTLCMEHNLMKKNYSQTEAGKRYFIKMYEQAVSNNDGRMIDFCKCVFECYDKYGVNGHITRPYSKEE